MTATLTPTPDEPPEPAARMTLKVYAVDPRTRARTLVKTTTSSGTDPLPVLGVSTAYPRCQCRRCLLTKREEEGR